MKKIYFFILTVMSAGASAQMIPNGAFETWANGEPVNWVTANLFCAGSTTQTAVVHGGTSAVKMETKALGFNPFPGIIPDTVPGLVVLSANQNISQRTGIPYTARPTTFTFYYKYAPVGNDTGVAFVNLTKWNTNTNLAENVGQGGLLINAAGTYTMGTSPMTYYSQLVPDSLTIVFASSRGATFGGSAAMPGSILYVDDASLTGGDVGIHEPFSFSSNAVFPNPATNNISIATQAGPSNEAKIVVYDLTGKVVAEQFNNTPYCELNTSSFSNGIYCYQVISTNSNALAGSGKFTISK